MSTEMIFAGILLVFSLAVPGTRRLVIFGLLSILEALLEIGYHALLVLVVKPLTLVAWIALKSAQGYGDQWAEGILNNRKVTRQHEREMKRQALKNKASAYYSDEQQRIRRRKADRLQADRERRLRQQARKTRELERELGLR